MVERKTLGAVFIAFLGKDFFALGGKNSPMTAGLLVQIIRLGKDQVMGGMGSHSYMYQQDSRIGDTP